MSSYKLPKMEPRAAEAVADEDEASANAKAKGGKTGKS